MVARRTRRGMKYGTKTDRAESFHDKDKAARKSEVALCFFTIQQFAVW
jgi:hypothetical protein